jgi:hypothetical protein
MGGNPIVTVPFSGIYDFVDLANLEAAAGLEPANNGFANRPLSHLGTRPSRVIRL